MNNDAIKLGLMPPLTGLVSIYGEEISRAGQIACAEINASGGVLGRTLELVIEDDGSLPESAVAAAEKLLDQHHCAAIIGNLLSNSRIAVAYRVAEPRKIPYLNFSFYEGSILSRYFFHFAALPNQQIDRMIPYMRQKFGPRMFFAGNNYEWPRGSIHAAKLALERVSGKVVGEEYTPIGVDAETIERLLDHVTAASPDVFVPYFAGPDQTHLLTRFTQRGMKQHIAVVMGHYDEMMASTLSAEVREGFYSSNTYFMSVDTAENRDYLAQLARLPGVSGIWPKGNGILTNFGEGTYVCVRAFAQAANLAGNLDSEALVEALKTINISAPQGKVQMNPMHHHARVNTYLTHCEANGTFTIVEKFGAIEPALPERYKHQQVSQRAMLEDDVRLQSRMLEQMSEAILLISTQNGAILYMCAGAARLFGYDEGEMLGLHIARLYDPSMNDPIDTAAEIIRILNQKGEWQGEVHNIKKDGTPIWCYETVSTFTHPVHGEVWLAVQRDITERKQVEMNLAESENRLRAIIDNEPECIKIVDAQGLLTQMNPAGLAMIEADSLEQLVGKPVLDIVAPEYREAFDAMHKRVIAGEAMQMEFEVIGLKGGRRWLETHAVPMMDHGETVLLAVTRDISEHKQMEAQVRQLAFDDPLTKLPNRRLLNDRLSQVISANKRRGCYGAVMFLDLDNFKPLNDTHGHVVGDLLLIDVAARLKCCVREMDTVARFGGDEFVVILSELGVDKAESISQARIVAEKIRTTLSEPYLLSISKKGKTDSTITHHCTASIGVVMFSIHESRQDDLLEWADLAMYQAKEAGRNQVQFYEERT